MRKVVVFLLALSFVACGPKRMKCYGRRCVTIDIQPVHSPNSKLPG
ncbi:hypothetical protein [Flavobacterium sp.]|nr:hypothetical protein [Flavobacterium sp.]MCZ8144179.1 hypothetical protein [Flavobacterium sp.]MCZ8365957.1 hypothetical protein [Flavobacterium sp.]